MHFARVLTTALGFRMKARIITNDREKADLLKRLSDQRIALMFFYEDEPPTSIAHNRVADQTWLVHPPYEYSELEKWLYLGNWHAIYPSNQNYLPFNSFKSKTDEIETRLREAGVKLLIDSFHDDIEWHVIEET